MRRSSIAPKCVVGALFLIVSIIISFPCAGVFFNRTLGGGIFDINEVRESELRKNLPIEGDLFSVTAHYGDGYIESSGIFSADNYYYLIPFGENKLMLMKTASGTDIYQDVSNLLRASSSSDSSSANSLFVSGVIKKNTAGAEEYYKQFSENNGLSEYELVPYTLDCSKTISQYCTRFLISLIFYAGFAICVYMVIRAINKNNEADYTEHRRAMVQAVQNAKSGTNEDESYGDGGMFGDSSQTKNAPQTEYQFKGAYEPKFQSQGGEPINTTANSLYSQKNNSDDDYDGFFGAPSGGNARTAVQSEANRNSGTYNEEASKEDFFEQWKKRQS